MGVTRRYFLKAKCTEIAIVVANYIHIEIQCSVIKLYDITNNNPPNFQNREAFKFWDSVRLILET